LDYSINKGGITRAVEILPFVTFIRVIIPHGDGFTYYPLNLL